MDQSPFRISTGPTTLLGCGATIRFVTKAENLKLDVSENPAVVSADGQIDAHTAPSLEEALDGVAAESTVSLDLSQVTFIDSSGLRVIVRTHKRLAETGGQLVIAEPSEPVMRLLDITGLTSELEIESVA